MQARTAKRGDQTIVEEILAVQSVDLVADPATTRGLFESETPSTGDPDSSARVAGAGAGCEASVSADPVLLEQPETLNLERETRPDPATEIESLRHEITRLQAAQAIATKRTAIAALLVEHGLPPLDLRDPAAQAITSDSFVESLLSAPDQPAMRAFIRDRTSLVEQARRWPADRACARIRNGPHVARANVDRVANRRFDRRIECHRC